MSREVFIVSTARTPVGKRNGYLREWIAPMLLGHVLDAVVEKIDLDPGLVEDNITGCVYQVGEQGVTLARTGVYASKFPDHVPGMTVNRQCGSSLTALITAYAKIASGIHEVAIASGCELMSKYPIGVDVGGTLMNGQPMGMPYGEYYFKRVENQMMDQMNAAQQIAKEYNITKEDCMDLAIASHKNAHKATEEGYFKNEIVPTKGKDKDGNEIEMTRDETIRSDTSIEKLETLSPVSGTEWITAGLSSPVTDGASAIVLMSGEKVKELNLTPIARVAHCAVIGSNPRLMLTGPVEIWPKMVKKSGLDKDDIDIFEVNEAFAPIPLAFVKTYDIDLEKLNVNGGAMALGHPVGNSGSRLAMTAAHELKRRGGKYAYITLCTGVAMAPAVILERA